MNSKKWLYSLLASMGLNLFLLGVLTVHLMRPGKPHPVHDGPAGRAALEDAEGPMMLRRMVRTLGGPQDPRVRELWQERRPELQRFRQEREQARQAVRAALAREPFEPEALSRALSVLNETNCSAQRRASTAVVELADKLSPEQRASIAEPDPPGHRRRPRSD